MRHDPPADARSGDTVAMGTTTTAITTAGYTERERPAQSGRRSRDTAVEVRRRGDGQPPVAMISGPMPFGYRREQSGEEDSTNPLRPSTTNVSKPLSVFSVLFGSL